MKHGPMLALLGASLIPLAARAAPPPPKPRFYVAVREVNEEKKAKDCQLAAKAQALFASLLEAQHLITTRLDATPPPKGKALASELERRRLVGYGAVLRLTACSHALHPPRPGKSYKVLMVDVGVAIDAEKIPSGQMARAGTGSAQVGTEVSRIKAKELQSLREEALSAAIKQAVKDFVSTLDRKKGRGARRGKQRRRR